MATTLMLGITQTMYGALPVSAILSVIIGSTSVMHTSFGFYNLIWIIVSVNMTPY